MSERVKDGTRERSLTNIERELQIQKSEGRLQKEKDEVRGREAQTERQKKINVSFYY